MNVHTANFLSRKTDISKMQLSKVKKSAEKIAFLEK